jgi:hypothetical protein
VSYTIRTARVEDLPALAAIERAALHLFAEAVSNVLMRLEL